MVMCRFFLSVLLLFCTFIADAQKRPVIGISDLHKDGTNAAVPRSYVDAVLQTGGVPVVIPLMHENEIIELLNSLDGVIFTGGEDFDPAYYNERPIPQMGKVNAVRDEFDIRTLRLAVERGLPVLGICRGVQLINIAYGGSLYQDLPAQYYDNSIRHRQRQPKEEASHSVLVENNTVFAGIVKERMLMVNSSHHQAIKKVAEGFRVAGKSPDKIVEVIEKIDSENWILGVQFHPETRVLQDNAMRKIFRSFIDEASKTEKPYERVRTASVSRSQPQPQLRVNTEPVYRSVVDTQYIYKFTVDTQYVYKNTDPVYISVTDTQYVYIKADTVYKSIVDTQYVYKNVDPTYLSAIDIQYIHVADTVFLPAAGLPPVTTRIDTFYVFVSDTVYINSPGIVTPVFDTPKIESVTKEEKTENVQIENTVKKTEEKDEKQLRKEQKERDKIAKEEQSLKEKQAKKELKEREQQAKNELKEHKEKEKWAKKEAEEKERQFKRTQKENAKLDKEEQKKAKQNEPDATSQ